MVLLLHSASFKVQGGGYVSLHRKNKHLMLGNHFYVYIALYMITTVSKTPKIHEAGRVFHC